MLQSQQDRTKSERIVAVHQQGASKIEVTDDSLRVVISASNGEIEALLFNLRIKGQQAIFASSRRFALSSGIYSAVPHDQGSSGALFLIFFSARI